MKNDNQETKNMSIVERVSLLSKANWNYVDIGKFFGYSKTKSVAIKNQARERNGNMPIFDKSKATVISVLGLCGSTLENEIHKVKMLSEAENGQQE